MAKHGLKIRVRSNKHTSPYNKIFRSDYRWILECNGHEFHFFRGQGALEGVRNIINNPHKWDDIHFDWIGGWVTHSYPKIDRG